MKRKLLVLVMALASVAAVTGCEKKEDKKEESGNNTSQKDNRTLSCTGVEDNEEEKYSFTFDGNNFSKVVYTSTTTYDSEKEAKKANEKDAKDVTEMGSMKGIVANAQLAGKKTVNTITFKVSELDADSKSFYSQLLGELDGKSYDEVKSILETATYTCK